MDSYDVYGRRSTSKEPQINQDMPGLYFGMNSAVTKDHTSIGSTEKDMQASAAFLACAVDQNNVSTVRDSNRFLPPEPQSVTLVGSQYDTEPFQFDVQPVTRGRELIEVELPRPSSDISHTVRNERPDTLTQREAEEVAAKATRNNSPIKGLVVDSLRDLDLPHMIMLNEASHQSSFRHEPRTDAELIEKLKADVREKNYSVKDAEY